MESGVGAGAILTDHEPGIPGGETPPSTAGGTPAATDARFMESGLFKNDLLTGLEPDEAEGRLRLRKKNLHRKLRQSHLKLLESSLVSIHLLGLVKFQLPKKIFLSSFKKRRKNKIFHLLLFLSQLSLEL